MLKIRFFRTGKKNQPFFKIVVIENKRASKGGRFVEELGFRNPLTKEVSLKKDRAKYWISVGAKMSNSIHNLLIKEKVLEGSKIPLHNKKKGESSSAEQEKGKNENKQDEKQEVEKDITVDKEKKEENRNEEDDKKGEPKQADSEINSNNEEKQEQVSEGKVAEEKNQEAETGEEKKEK